MKIEILGTGCPKCQTLMNNVEAAISELGIEAAISKVTDIVEIASRGVMMTPALVVDGQVKSVGKLPSVEDIKGMIS